MKPPVWAALALASCAGAADVKPAATPSYTAEVRWLCLPGASLDACKTDLTATAITPDGRKLEAHHAATNPSVDCFYVYPTVDLELVPGNHEDFSDTRKERRTTLAQVGRFNEACAVWAPLYRQVTIGTYLRSKERLEKGLAIAFADVAAAFREYLARSDKQHKIVLVGHSQGAEMVVRLIKTFFDHDPAMRERLTLAMPIGGDVETAVGKTTGGTFENVPVCTKPNETGCVVAYRSFAAGDPVEIIDRWSPSPGHVIACVNPAAIDGGSGRFSHAYLPLGETRRFMRGVEGVETPYIDVPDFYSGQCVTQPSGFSYLAVTEAPSAGDGRVSPVNLHRQPLPKMGLHLLDMQLTQGDLIDMVKRRSGTS
jgi:Protein of unknown function (DUF3089)